MRLLALACLLALTATTAAEARPRVGLAEGRSAAHTYATKAAALSPPTTYKLGRCRQIRKHVDCDIVWLNSLEEWTDDDTGEVVHSEVIPRYASRVIVKRKGRALHASEPAFQAYCLIRRRKAKCEFP